MPEGSKLMVACVKKRPNRRYDFESCLAEESRHRGLTSLIKPASAGDSDYEAWFEPLPPLPVITSQEVSFQEGTIPDEGCVPCSVTFKTCIPTTLGASCMNCIKTDGKHCDHSYTVEEYIALHSEISTAFGHATDVTKMYFCGLADAIDDLSNTAEAHYASAKRMKHCLSLVLAHSLKVVHLVGTENFCRWFTVPDSDPCIVDAVNGLVNMYNSLTIEERNNLTANEHLSFPPVLMTTDHGRLIKTNYEAIEKEFSRSQPAIVESKDVNMEGEVAAPSVGGA
ncbi:hypothetical protein MVEN_02313600 [Mycena venus]|uniref:Uncharacterized protein n=1 Tax=Mycena venus TaxID=2733690 RepID=A0A8H6X422_9AGAR|nr:hypothetical protein MVEN_02313600 [Mycena venus]